ncbi:MAG TPA: hypothetical protein VMV46_00295, partial [Thermoanaerobaculia bacterium]|nr:hypothetical protein [Thermoanaerobaculia bacterium]
GLVVWPAGAAQLLARQAARRRRAAKADPSSPDEPPPGPALAIWVAAAAVTAALYGRGAALGRTAADLVPGAAAGHTLAFLGSPLVQWWPSPVAAMVAGGVGLGLATRGTWRELARGGSGGPWLGLGLFSLGAATMTALGRSSYGLDQALSSRYTTLANLFWIALLGGLLAGSTAVRGRGPLVAAAVLGALVLAGSAASLDGFVGQHAMRAPARAFLARGVVVEELAPLVAGDLALLDSAGREICAQRTSVFRALREEEVDCRFERWPVAVDGQRTLPSRHFRWEADGAVAAGGRLRSSEGFVTPMRSDAVEGQWSLVRDEGGRRCLRGWARDARTLQPVTELIVVEGAAGLRVAFRREERPALAGAGPQPRFLGVAACWPAMEPGGSVPVAVFATNDRGGTGALERRR